MLDAVQAERETKHKGRCKLLTKSEKALSYGIRKGIIWYTPFRIRRRSCFSVHCVGVISQAEQSDSMKIARNNLRNKGHV